MNEDSLVSSKYVFLEMTNITNIIRRLVGTTNNGPEGLNGAFGIISLLADISKNLLQKMIQIPHY